MASTRYLNTLSDALRVRKAFQQQCTVALRPSGFACKERFACTQNTVLCIVRRFEAGEEILPVRLGSILAQCCTMGSERQVVAAVKQWCSSQTDY